MPGIPPEIEVYPIQHLPIIKAYADQLGLVGLINHYVPTEMDVDAGTVVLGLVLDTLSGRSPLYRLEEFFAHQDTELLLGKALPPQAFTDDTVGRVLDRLYDMGTMKLFTACAVRAAARFGLERRYVHFDTTSCSVWGDYQFAEEQDVPFQVTYGYSKDKRPDLKQFVLSTLCVERAVPIWGKPEDGNASDKTLNTTLLSEIAQLLAHYGVQPGAYIYIADAALVTEANLAALGDTLFITRLPATYSECERVIGEAVARNRWEEVGVLAQTPPTQHRPGTCYKVAEDVRDPIRQDLSGGGRALQQPGSTAAEAPGAGVPGVLYDPGGDRAPGSPAGVCLSGGCRGGRGKSCGRCRAPITAWRWSSRSAPSMALDGPASIRPRVVKALRYGLQATLHERAEVIARKRQETGCFVLLTNVPTVGEMAHRAGDVLRAYKEQHGIEQNFGFLKDPLIVNSLFLKKPERIEALGLVLLLALLLWRLMERSLRLHVETTGNALTRLG